MTGVRIKIWLASLPGVATDMHFEDITMNNVSDLVLIDQGYCPWNQCTAGVPSKVKISKVSYKNIKGTSLLTLISPTRGLIVSQLLFVKMLLRT
ncbi:hypothetical protein SAY86_020202 [Trapa natans]|uniref:Polygalacturonase n=1 Tax=Trapa natans TaxID=22666 RepID=A0AAN7R7G6_TRANT|nr:hypothetical protein SAY86_020202 [Trapa natans]